MVNGAKMAGFTQIIFRHKTNKNGNLQTNNLNKSLFPKTQYTRHRKFTIYITRIILVKYLFNKTATQKEKADVQIVQHSNLS